jgi:hypothetical protein
MKTLLTAMFFGLTSCTVFADKVEKMPLVMEDDELNDQEIAYAWELAGKEFDTTLFGGKPVEEGELPMVFNVGFCTVTVVGPQVFHSASHCHSTGSQASFVYKGVRRTGTCTRHPQYNGSTTQNDWALCKFSPAIDEKDFIFGSLKATKLAIGDMLILNGYGRGSSNGRLHWGKAPVARITTQEYWTDSSTVLGGGDSGGPLFKDQSSLKTGPFLVVGVNSRAGGRTSIFNYTAHENAQSFYKSYAEKNSVEICGVTKECGEGSEPPPPPPPSIPEHCKVEKLMYESMLAKTKKFESYLKNCK